MQNGGFKKMIEAIYISIVHLWYYSYFYLLSDILRAGRATDSRHVEIEKLRNYGYKVVTFQYNGKLYGFANFKSIYLNENLLKTKSRGKSDAYYALKWVFFHEYYHLKNNHKRNLLLLRLALSLSPLVALIFSWYIALFVYLSVVGVIYYFSNKYEEEANEYAKNQLS